MLLHYLFLLLPLGALASPITRDETRLQINWEKLEKALVDFGFENFTWPELELDLVYHRSLKGDGLPEIGGDNVDAPEDGLEPDVSDEELVVETALTEDIPEENTDAIQTLKHLVLNDSEGTDGFSEREGEMEGASLEDTAPPVIVLPEAPDLSSLVEPPEENTLEPPKPKFILRHPANDNPVDPERDVYHSFVVDRTRPICSFFQHSVLGDDFGESTFPRISYISSEALPFRVHYAPEDSLRFEAYKWPFAACNHGCELQGLAIRAKFDWELDPVNEDSPFDAETKQALKVAREICQWKNIHHHFAVSDCGGSDLRKRLLQPFTSEVFAKLNLTGIALPAKTASPLRTVGMEIPAATASAKQNLLAPLNVQTTNGLYLSDEARSAMREIEGIFGSTHGPQDLANMFHTVILACQVHRYSSSPMSELQPSSVPLMVQEAMNQVGRIFAETAGKINVWETRDAIVRATQIYRYQQEHGG